MEPKKQDIVSFIYASNSSIYVSLVYEFSTFLYVFLHLSNYSCIQQPILWIHRIVLRHTALAPSCTLPHRTCLPSNNPITAPSPQRPFPFLFLGFLLMSRSLFPCFLPHLHTLFPFSFFPLSFLYLGPPFPPFFLSSFSHSLFFLNFRKGV